MEKITSIKKLLPKVYSNLEEIYNSENNVVGISTGFYDLDIMTLGLKKSELIIVASRPSVGKTPFILNIASYVATNNKNVLIFSLNQSKENLIKRLLFTHAEIASGRLYSKRMTENHWDKLKESINILSDIPLYVDDSSILSISEIQDKCQKFAQKPDLIIIDGIENLMEYNTKKLENVIPRISFNLKHLSKTLNIPVIATYPLTWMEDDARPELAEFRETGSIDKFADTVYFIHRNYFYDGDDSNRDRAEIIIAKNQFTDSVGSFDLIYDIRYGKFKNIALRPIL